MGKILLYVFVLSFIIIAVAYNKGTVPLVNSLGSGLNQGLAIVTGRQTQGPNAGKFAAYPS